MRNTLKRTLAIALVLLIVVSMIPSALAATVSSVSHTTDVQGKNVTIFYVNAKNKNTTKLNYSCTKGAFNTNYGSINGRGFFEILVYGRNSTSAGWNYISKTNMKDVASTTLSMSGYTQYKVRIYSWDTRTIASYTGRNSSAPMWVYWCQPTCTFTARSNVKSLAK